jgi:hypothetical protein
MTAEQKKSCCCFLTFFWLLTHENVHWNQILGQAIGALCSSGNHAKSWWIKYIWRHCRIEFKADLEKGELLSNFLCSNSFYLLKPSLSKTIDYFGDFVGTIHSVPNNSPNSSIFCGSKGDAQKYASESDSMRDAIHFTSSTKFNPNQTMHAIKSAKIRASANNDIATAFNKWTICINKWTIN